METKSLKALSEDLLQGNRQGNIKETLSFQQGNFMETRLLDQMETEYFRLLKRAFSLDDTKYGEEGYRELQGLVVELDRLYRELHRQGRRVPVRLPVEQNRPCEQTELAL